MMGGTDYAPLTTNTINNALVDYFGYNARTISTTSQIASLKSTYGFTIYGQTMNFSRLNTDWAPLKATLNYTTINQSSKSFVTFYFNSSNYSNYTSECAAIAANVTDFASYPYSTGLVFMVIDLNATGTGNKSDFVDNVAGCLLNATNNRIPVYSTYTVNTSVAYSSAFDIPQVDDAGNLTQSINSERGWLRNSTSVARIYSGTNTTFLAFAKSYYNTIMRQLRSTPEGKAHSDPNIGTMTNGDIVIFNNGTTIANKTTNFSTTKNGAWDGAQYNLYKPLTNASNIEIPAQFAVAL
jgi:hypothetical protein